MDCNHLDFYPLSGGILLLLAASTTFTRLERRLLRIFIVAQESGDRFSLFMTNDHLWIFFYIYSISVYKEQCKIFFQILASLYFLSIDNRFFRLRTMLIVGQFLSRNTVFIYEKLSKMSAVCPNCISWRSNQEWRSICTDTVFEAFLSLFSVNHKFGSRHAKS